MANCEASTRSGCSKKIVSGPTTFYDVERGGRLLAARIEATTLCATTDLVALNPSITENCKNWYLEV